MKKKWPTVNQRQREFYDSKKKNFPTRLWSSLRNGALNRIKKRVGIEADIYMLHKSWFGDLSEKKVLDLGCYEGNSLSFYLAENSKSYLGIDLSPKGIENLNRRLKNIPGARAEAMDFLSEAFEEKNFDLIYAYGVLHHFKDLDQLILKLKEKLNQDGIIVSHDPLETSLPIKTIRRIYRPFQSDRDWEWPFNRKTYYSFAKEFKIVERRAVLGKTKWTALLNILSVSQEKKVQKAAAWHREDWERSTVDDEHMFSCMHLSMLMQKKE
ncbi:class I SAM-dependent methyltransferase [Salinimicrobium sp. MT39]|uniref:Class I SAM-dependent methyltransferase n=1 Tax=Salinimicrobium profundisediminis TaxID=2994553 RepID=A0A9X3I118_9FLAO|nr:class I SAM-dependent methyltransferase [Salinimicrobium profundisediminis]MCX2837502.1 class I SAM-dependent methyltransferase [Salinimicrobium profundisediminis]